MDSLTKWLLAKAMLAHFHGTYGCPAMVVVRDGNSHRINVFANLVQHFAIISKKFKLWKFFSELFGFRIQSSFIYIAESNNVAGTLSRISAVSVPFAIDANAGDLYSSICTQNPAPADVWEGHRESANPQGGGLQKIATRD
jgi:hypothetical protein